MRPAASSRACSRLSGQFVAQRPVVEEREVDAVPDDDPEDQRDGGPRDARERAAAGGGDAAAHRGGEADDHERRAPVGHQRVLEQVGDQEVVGRERLERRVDRDGDQQQAEREDGGAAGAGPFFRR